MKLKRHITGMSISKRTPPARQRKRANYRWQQCVVALCVQEFVHSRSDVPENKLKEK